METQLISEIQAIIDYYNSSVIKVSGWVDWGDLETVNDITLNNFESDIDWDWIGNNYHISHAFIWEYNKKLNMQYLFDNLVITTDEFLKIKARESIINRFEILDL